MIVDYGQWVEMDLCFDPWMQQRFEEIHSQLVRNGNVWLQCRSG